MNFMTSILLLSSQAYLHSTFTHYTSNFSAIETPAPFIQNTSSLNYNETNHIFAKIESEHQVYDSSRSTDDTSDSVSAVDLDHLKKIIIGGRTFLACTDCDDSSYSDSEEQIFAQAPIQEPMGLELERHGGEYMPIYKRDVQAQQILEDGKIRELAKKLLKWGIKEPFEKMHPPKRPAHRCKEEASKPKEKEVKHITKVMTVTVSKTVTVGKNEPSKPTKNHFLSMLTSILQSSTAAKYPPRITVTSKWTSQVTKTVDVPGGLVKTHSGRFDFSSSVPNKFSSAALPTTTNTRRIPPQVTSPTELPLLPTATSTFSTSSTRKVGSTNDESFLSKLTSLLPTTTLKVYPLPVPDFHSTLDGFSSQHQRKLLTLSENTKGAISTTRPRHDSSSQSDFESFPTEPFFEDDDFPNEDDYGFEITTTTSKPPPPHKALPLTSLRHEARTTRKITHSSANVKSRFPSTEWEEQDSSRRLESQYDVSSTFVPKPPSSISMPSTYWTNTKFFPSQSISLDPTTTPEPEPEFEPQPEPEPEPESEFGPQPKPESESKSEPKPEPEPAFKPSITQKKNTADFELNVPTPPPFLKPSSEETRYAADSSTSFNLGSSATSEAPSKSPSSPVKTSGTTKSLTLSDSPKKKKKTSSPPLDASKPEPSQVREDVVFESELDTEAEDETDSFPMSTGIFVPDDSVFSTAFPSPSAPETAPSFKFSSPNASLVKSVITPIPSATRDSPETTSHRILPIDSKHTGFIDGKGGHSGNSGKEKIIDVPKSWKSLFSKIIASTSARKTIHSTSTSKSTLQYLKPTKSQSIPFPTRTAVEHDEGYLCIGTCEETQSQVTGTKSAPILTKPSTGTKSQKQKSYTLDTDGELSISTTSGVKHGLTRTQEEEEEKEADPPSVSDDPEMTYSILPIGGTTIVYSNPGVSELPTVPSHYFENPDESETSGGTTTAMNMLDPDHFFSSPIQSSEPPAAEQPEVTYSILPIEGTTIILNPDDAPPMPFPNFQDPPEESGPEITYSILPIGGTTIILDPERAFETETEPGFPPDMPTGIPMEMPTDMDMPMEMPTGVPTGMPTGMPSWFPSTFSLTFPTRMRSTFSRPAPSDEPEVSAPTSSMSGHRSRAKASSSSMSRSRYIEELISNISASLLPRNHSLDLPKLTTRSPRAKTKSVSSANGTTFVNGTLSYASASKKDPRLTGITLTPEPSGQSNAKAASKQASQGFTGVVLPPRQHILRSFSTVLDLSGCYMAMGALILVVSLMVLG
ncbi:uncharacterized protein LODBEIA_P52730 [Lodderomyces beijingensis]|uniref:Uncharacterized protein n=1 Tax=Lodderomyces beijingensis TaxID=1775926 RepID=A0ABP0ZSG2_9ASCO